MVNMPGLDNRKQVILDALEAALARQGRVELAGLDLVALAVEVDQALGGDGVMPGESYDNGKEPDELNAANDG